MAPSSLPQLTPLELASYVLLGWSEPAPLPSISTPPNPRKALERAIRVALERPPCGVAFSGGRDSSVVLAIAAAVARRDGLPLPIPLTLRFRDSVETEESEWQEMVIRHIGLNDWETIELTDELDLVGEIGQRSLRHFGPHSPPQLHFLVPMLDRLTGGTVLTGEYSDDVFDGHRIAAARDAWHKLLRRRRPKYIASIAWNLAPRSVRRAISPRRPGTRRLGDNPWLRPDAETELNHLMSLERAAEPLRWDHWIEWIRGRRVLTYSVPFQQPWDDEFGVAQIDPFWDGEFLAHAKALSRGVGWLDRTAAFRALAGDLLPAALIERKSKAAFHDAFVGAPSRQFIATWDGTGIDADIVDVDALRETWSDNVVDVGTYSLLRAAWWSRYRPLPQTITESHVTDQY